MVTFLGISSQILSQMVWTRVPNDRDLVKQHGGFKFKIEDAIL